MFVGVKNHGFSTVVSAFITGLTSNDVCLAVVASPRAAVVGECQEGIYVAQGRSPDRKVHSIFHSPPGIPRARAGWGRGALEPPPFPLPLQTAPCTQRKPSARPTQAVAVAAQAQRVLEGVARAGASEAHHAPRGRVLHSTLSRQYCVACSDDPGHLRSRRSFRCAGPGLC